MLILDYLIYYQNIDDGFTVNFMEYSGRDCKEEKCLWTTNECYESFIW